MSKSQLIIRIITRALHTLPFVLTVMIGVPIAGMALNEAAKLTGQRSLPVPVVGTGSMYPSLFWSKDEGGPEDVSKKMIEEYRSIPHLYRRFRGFTLLNKTFLRRGLGYGDMVAFRNDKTVEILKSDGHDTSAGFIKRIVGVPGDTIELRDGFVYKNNELLSEPYIASPRSTYGGSSLEDCQKLTLPPSTYFVLGDNRKVSSDSRFELGVVAENDIEYVLPYNEQKVYHSLYRDTSKDDDLLGQPTLSDKEFVELVNAERKKMGNSNLAIKPSLTKSSALRGDTLLTNPKSTQSMKQAISSAGYNNIILGEFISHGHFTAKELIASLQFNASTAKQILGKDYTDIGVSAVNKVINGCPTQIIVGHLGGYVPASYEESTISSWRELKVNLGEVIPSWEKAFDYNYLDTAKLTELLTILRRRQSLAGEIVTTMERKEWLSDSQTARIKSDDSDAKRSEQLIKELNQ